MLGFGPDELMGATTRQLYFDEASYETFGREAYAQMMAGRTYRAQLPLARKDGSPIWVEMSGAPLEAGESVWMMQDITLLKQKQAQVEQIAFYDLLTGLPNRVLLRDRLSQMLEGCERMKCLLAVCFVDLDGFKEVNDAFGHDLGDVVLKESARRMQECVRSSDTVARLGGDEFVLALSPVHSRQECEPVLARAIAELCLPIPLGGGREARVSASIGVALYPSDGNVAEVLLARADEAMYLAKRGGRNRVQFC
jgi:diguanylate cyclase (GGDEF)-like protein